MLRSRKTPLYFGDLIRAVFVASFELDKFKFLRINNEDFIMLLLKNQKTKTKFICIILSKQKWENILPGLQYILTITTHYCARHLVRSILGLS